MKAFLASLTSQQQRERAAGRTARFLLEALSTARGNKGSGMKRLGACS